MECRFTNSYDLSLHARARKVVPNGVWGHMATSAIGPGYPQFFAKSEGCRVWDVDGNEYIDFMCAWGPNLLGYKRAEVDAAAIRQLGRGDIGNGPTELMVELAESLVDTIEYADWVLFQKNGTDATTTCVTVARAATGRRKVLVARGAYHGAVPWCSPSLVGVAAEDRAHLITFEYNDVVSLNEAVASAGDDLAGILMTAYRHDVNRDQEMPDVEFLRHARALCNRAGAALILDDVRAGFRLDVRGSWAQYGVKPDLGAYSKAIANGWPLAAVAGNTSMLEGASKIFVTGSFWYASAAMAAGLKTLELLRTTNALAHIEAMGNRFRKGLATIALRHGFRLIQTGPVQMPMIRFENDSDLRVANVFCAAALRHGIYLHPRHNLFLCAAHQEADIDRALYAVDSAMRDAAAAT
ncbi:aminotransferase class III-fold pyridoxal phosphate-dependent enzyme [Mesorhizobium sp.]|uniref:aminotransferase class III-fold pyridoxal phosphate-dependent enzyme n=1 Tax=Mesorhizobium sp. TaxID=1871066 RepID=UPI000FEA2B6F|nr:aminotransferase class III-fold pyridoxal phosphate-dependent enzyme [Mesorhizobium sp.]RWK43427.1 MAG: aminotransferase class III-fold pyridoxal phosphate-dependent enzyme [Mesorhizobium sp.]RWK69951.1 MAG: aminotransferase class III-fold pyridoxal phosphate-dependent enzyme [Mesorhizobium sp.]RWK77140.1 MAG: aminotransferase class III-fold pyridoxal phosphate-dependent enzyme [Mesorhizobium sp.]RWK80126.1 MAG: aminotransferase class III-fold pyridoxal phosphate-dependent enzyme [Mesorhizob